MNTYGRSIAMMLILLTLSTGCATLTTATHFTKDSPMVYSGARLDIHASAGHEDMLRVYKDKYGLEPPAYPRLDLPFSLLFDTIILFPLVLPIYLYQVVFE